MMVILEMNGDVVLYCLLKLKRNTLGNLPRHYWETNQFSAEIRRKWISSVSASETELFQS